MKIKTIFLYFSITIFSLQPHSSSASGIPVVDIAALIQAVMDAINQATQITNQVTQIQNQVQSLQNQAKSLQSLGSGNFNALNTNFSQQLGSIQSVLSSAQNISYSVQNVRSQFDTLFPQGTDWSTIDSSQYGDFYQQWNSAMSEAAQTAMSAQSILAKVQQDNATAQNILSSVNGADGEVRQLQASNQMLSVLSQQMTSLNQTVATSGRVSATMAARAAAEDEIQQKAKADLLNNYTDKGQAVQVHNQLPRVR